MIDDRDRAAGATALRERAEAALRARTAPTPPVSEEEAQRLLHELQVHQIELEMQNGELQAAQEELARSRDRYVDLYEFAPVGYLTVSEAGVVSEANLTAAALLCVPRSALVAQPFSRFVHREDQDLYYLGRKRLFASGEPQTIELRVVRGDGLVRTTQFTATRAWDERGAQVLRAVFSDLTERRRLEAVVAQQERLSSMGMLAAGVAHEINNPLTYVLSNVEHLLEALPRFCAAAEECAAARRAAGEPEHACRVLHSEAYAESAECAKEAANGTHRIREISRRLGAFSRVEQLELATIDLNESISAAAAMAANEIRFRATLVISLGELPKVRAVEGKLAQVFLNLLLNAAHAIAPGDAAKHRITIRSWSESGSVFAEVSDTGHGIAAEDLPRIFEPFFSTKPVGLGSGLGLAICRSLLSEFGGEISAQSRPREGARFLVRLPVASATRAPESRPPVAPVAIAAPTPDATPARRGRVLVVDDEPYVAKSLVRILRRAHDVETVASGREAMALLAHDRNFDVVLTDLMMPEVSGMALHTWLAEAEPELARRLLFMTGGAFTADASEYLARAGNMVIEKPFDAPLVNRLVAERVAARPR
jgi:PAS domain S-box-containing protein